MPKMVDGSIACRISYAPEYSGKKFYCDHCGETFDDREKPPCEAAAVQTPPLVVGTDHVGTSAPAPVQLDFESYSGELSDNFEIAGVIPIPQKALLGKKKK